MTIEVTAVHQMLLTFPPSRAKIWKQQRARLGGQSTARRGSRPALLEPELG